MAAIVKDGSAVSSQAKIMNRGQAEALLPMIQHVMAQANVGFHELDTIATIRGPGSFTGLRLGLAAARGFALVHHAACIGVDGFAALAFEAWFFGYRGSLLTVIDSRREDRYVQKYTINDSGVMPDGQPFLALPENIISRLQASQGLHICGSGLSTAILKSFGANTLHEVVYASPRAIEKAALNTPSIKTDIYETLQPLYLRDADVTIYDKALIKH